MTLQVPGNWTIKNNAMTKVVSIFNYKGGVGKTTSTLNIGAGLALQGYRTLLVDLDPQANLSMSLGVDDPEVSIFHALRDQVTPPVVPVRDKLDLIPSSMDLIRVDVTLEKRNPVIRDREELGRILQPLHKRYDVILLDCPPALGNMTLSALIMSDLMLVPIEAEYLALKGYKILADTIQEYMGLPIRVFLTKYDNRKTLNRTIMETIRAALGRDAFSTVIRSNVALAEAPVHQKSIYEYAPNSHGSEDYGNLVQELRKYLWGKQSAH